MVHNYAGLLGAYISGTLSDLFGIAAYVWPLVCGAVGIACIAPLYELVWWRWLGYFLLTICLLFIGAAWNLHIGEIYGGGMVGATLYENASFLLSHWGSVILWFFLFCTALQLTFGISWLRLWHKTKALCQTRISAVERPALPQWTLPSIKGLWQKFTAKSEQKALPEVYDMDDPHIQVLTPNKKPFKESKYTQDRKRKATPDAQDMPHDITDNQDEYEDEYEPEYEYEDDKRHAYDDYDDDYDDEQHDNSENHDAQWAEQQAPAQQTSSEKKRPVKQGAPRATAQAADTEKKKESGGFFSFGKKKAAQEDVENSPEHAFAQQPTQQSKKENSSKNTEEYVHDSVDAFVDDTMDDYLEDTYTGQEHHDDDDTFLLDDVQEQPAYQAASAPTASSVTKPVAPVVSSKAPTVKTKYAFPSLDVLQSAKPSSPAARGEMEKKGQALVSCLADFGIQGELVHITPGPVVTMYAFRPAAGVRVNRIANLTDDIALALKAIAIRIQAPIPGSDTVGIEIPNVQREIVNFREILESSAFTEAGGPLNMVLGKNIAGKPFVSELSKMPHLLVAGATGAGKSVGLNTILMSLLYTTQPDDMQLLLIDPKRIEMAVYADLPHLVHPVVTEMQYAKTALEWAVAEMDKRYEAMARVGVRNITGYNQKLKDMGAQKPAELADLDALPYLVIIIDELADLMLTAAREVETSIVRLAQLARAAGIHMILATQRPSVDVVTGIIKANFPCRISFQVTSKHDSRTILDMVGAEHLLGKGDMLFKPSGGRLMRLHGPFVADEEVQAVVNHWKRQSPPRYKVNFAEWGQEQSESSGGGVAGDASSDSLYPEVRAFVEEQGKASISLVQRRFRIGFNRAAVLMEQLERDGIIGPADGSKPRSVIR